MKKENYFLILSLLFYLSSFAQAPGGVSAGLSLWTKSDNTTTGAWVDHSANANPIEVVGAMPLQAANASHNFQPYFTGFSTTNFFRDNTSSVAPANVFTPSDVTVISVVVNTKSTIAMIATVLAPIAATIRIGRLIINISVRIYNRNTKNFSIVNQVLYF